MEPSRTDVLGVLLGALLVVAYLVFSVVIPVIVFAITVAYVLYPVRQYLRRRGLSRRLASGLTTLALFVGMVLIVLPMAVAIFQRRWELVAQVRNLPESITIPVGGATRTIDLTPYQDAFLGFARDFLVDLAIATPELGLSLALFTILVYGLLYRPNDLRTAVFGLVPPQHHDIAQRLHERTRSTLIAIYVLQLATAVGTALIAYVVFGLLGYESPIWLAIIAGLLQFIPIIGPSVLIIGLAGAELAATGVSSRVVLVLVLGLFFIGILPDITIRPKLADLTGNFSSTLYFIGFVGGILTIGMIGVIVGPLVVALIVEVVDLLSEEQSNADAALAESG